jgi:hypothetical protein
MGSAGFRRRWITLRRKRPAQKQSPGLSSGTLLLRQANWRDQLPNRLRLLGDPTGSLRVGCVRTVG